MSLRALMISVRERAGLSKRGLARQSSWQNENITAFEKGRKGASVESIEDWFSACGFDLVAVPKGATDPREIEGLPDEHRKLLLRLVRLFPLLDEGRIDSVRGLVERWETQLEVSPTPLPAPNEEATAQDKRAKSS